MALAPFFDRVVASTRQVLSVRRSDLETALASTLIGVEIAESTENDLVAAELLVNLLSRLYPALLLTGPALVVHELEGVACAINPRIDLVRGKHATVPIRIGGSVAPDGGLLGRADGWVARVTRRTLDVARGPTNPYASGAVAALLASEVFRQVFASRLPPAEAGDVSVSLLDYSRLTGIAESLPRHLDLGRVAFCGVGAVGNAALWVLSKDESVSGVAHLIDPQSGELSNMQRYALLTMSNFSRKKVAVAARWFKGSRVEVVQHATSLQQLMRSSRLEFETMCASPDDIVTRRVAQAVLPRTIVNGCTNDTGGLAASWHQLDRNGACLACLYHPIAKRRGTAELLAEVIGMDPRDVSELLLSGTPLSPQQLSTIASHLRLDPAATADWAGKPISAIQAAMCGAADVDLTGRGRVDSVPLAHQSVLAGILMATELVKRTNCQLSTRAQGENLISWDDVTGPPPEQWTRNRRAVGGCICGDAAYRSAYSEKWDRSLTTAAANEVSSSR
jgi:hypothetical protein